MYLEYILEVELLGHKRTLFFVFIKYCYMFSKVHSNCRKCPFFHFANFLLDYLYFLVNFEGNVNTFRNIYIFLKDLTS